MGDYTFNEQVTVQYETMKTWIATVYQAVGMNRTDAYICADTIVTADMRGVYSHGSMRAAIYAKRMREGGTSPTAQPRVVNDFQATAVMDGDNAMGQIVAYRAMEVAIQKAREFGVGFVTARGSNHCGMLSYYADMAVKEDMIGIAMTAGSANGMAPFGGLDSRVGNNPYAVAFPTDRIPPVALDMANSTVARGKILMAARTGSAIPDTWALDEEGNPTTDPNKGLKGTLRPVGDYKGFNTALAVGYLSTMLSQAAFGEDIEDLYAGLGKPQNLGHTLMAIDVSKFVEVKTFEKNIERNVAWIRSSRTKPGKEILMPGEFEYRTAQRQKKDGIALPVEVIRDLVAISDETGVESMVKLDG